MRRFRVRTLARALGWDEAEGGLKPPSRSPKAEGGPEYAEGGLGPHFDGRNHQADKQLSDVLLDSSGTTAVDPVPSVPEDSFSGEEATAGAGLGSEEPSPQKWPASGPTNEDDSPEYTSGEKNRKLVLLKAGMRLEDIPTAAIPVADLTLDELKLELRIAAEAPFTDWMRQRVRQLVAAAERAS